MSGDRERCREAGCDGYETEPVQRDQLIDACATATRDAEAAGESLSHA